MKANCSLDYLICPKCLKKLTKKNGLLECIGCKSRFKVKEGIYQFLGSISEEERLSFEKWEKYYKDCLKNKKYIKNFDLYKNTYLLDTIRQLTYEKKIDSKTIYLEVGCGPFFLGQELAKCVKLIIGVDFCFSALKIAKKMLDQKSIKNYLLIQADVLKMPINSRKIDLIYGGGVIEHFRDTKAYVKEMFRVLKDGGLSFNTAPYLNLSSLTYRQRWGNIPNFPVLKQIAETVHIKLLKKRYMKFGYELSFLKGTLVKIHKNAGFRKIRAGAFCADLELLGMPKLLKKILVWLANNCFFFRPLIKVSAVK